MASGRLNQPALVSALANAARAYGDEMVVKEATVVAGRVLERLIQLGRLPDWNAFELGTPGA
jgi:hypothetical protein